jgi:F0F1-type ATP synthase assembly protein I
MPVVRQIILLCAMLHNEVRDIRKQENLHIVLWLVKDTFWVLDFKIGGVIMILPTLLVAIAITWRWRHLRAELFHNLAVCCWICANISWMIGEFYFDDSIRPVSIAFFSVGLIIIAYYYITDFVAGKVKQ